ncbi:MAG: SHOCT domain-containing protein [Haloplanus sp.]
MADLDAKTLVLLVLGALILLPILTMGMGGTMMGGPMTHGMWGGGTAMAPGWMLLLGVLGQVLFLVAIVGVGYLLYRGVTQAESDTDDALAELRLAYARGDLSDEEFERRRETLQREE